MIATTVITTRGTPLLFYIFFLINSEKYGSSGFPAKLAIISST
jgi:hypothetical protein